MFKSFFLSRQYFAWSVLGTLLIFISTWYQVQLDLDINDWYGDFFNLLQKALSGQNAIVYQDVLDTMWVYSKIVCMFVVISSITEFFTRHYIFRWREAMNNHYLSKWTLIRDIEGASQRVQEDTMRFAKICQDLALRFLDSLLTVFSYMPILLELSKHITYIPIIGDVHYSLVYIAMLSAIFGTTLLAVVGIKLPMLEYNNQRTEAAFRKELVLGEDDPQRAQPEQMNDLFADVKKNYSRMYLHYFYFDFAKWSYYRVSVLIPYITLGPTIASGLITWGILQQIIRAFKRVEGSFKFLVYSWSSIVELMSIYKRLKTFEIELAKRSEKREMQLKTERF